MGLSPTRNPPSSILPGREGAALSDNAIQAELEKILASETFREAEGLKRLLRYSVQNTLLGEGDSLKEYRLGLEVFDRNSSFDPRLDPVVRMAARRLRAKLLEYYEGEGGHDPVCIEMPKGGYAAAFSTPVHQVSPARAPSQRKHFWLVLVLSGFLMAFTVASVYWIGTLRSRVAAVQAEESSIAVLPFLNLSANQDDEYLGDGLADELTGSLSSVAGLRVIARTSAFKFKGKSEDVRTIGRQLNVASVLEGSLQRRGEEVRITVQLIRTSDGSHLWAETYDRSASNPFAFEDEITSAITRVLRIRLEKNRPSSAAARPLNPEAHDLYLRGRYWWNRRTPPAVWKSVAYFNQALEKEPLYPQAYLGLADAYTVLGFNDQAAADEVVPKARAAAEQALQMDDSLSEAHADLAAAILFHDWDQRRAEQELQSAIQLNPNSAKARQWYGILLMCEGRFEAAIKEFVQAERLDPLSLMIVLDVGQVHHYAGQDDAAIQQSQTVLAQDPNFAMAHDLLGMAYESQKRFPEARREFQKYVELSGRDPDALMRLAVNYAESNEPQRALELIQEMQGVPKGAYVPSYDIAMVYAALGEGDLAFQWLGRAVEEHSSSCLTLAIDPVFASWHSDPRFRKAAQTIGLPMHR